ncbi:MAG: hypothetical protein K0Q95_2981, partial [Bacteroidota bacterium]|nr:hypothetical protein [Bacteroidota bacterium]
AVLATINAAPSVASTTPGNRCGTGTIVLGATASAGTLNWYSVSTGGTSLGTGTSFTTPSISTTTTYYVDATNNGCTSARTAVVATINSTPSVATTTPGSRCGTGTVVLGATASAGTLTWYSVSTGGTSLGTGTSFTTPSISTTTTYYVDATNGGCTSARTAVLATINAAPSVASTTSGSRCGTGTVILGATASAGTLAWYSVSTGGSSLGTGISFTTPIISSTTTFYVSATNGGCTSARTALIATVNAAPSLSIVMTQSSCSDNDGSINLNITGGAPSYTYNWSNGASTEDINGLAAGSYTVTVTDANSCSSQNITSVTQNCGGAIVPNTQLAASQCGQTISDLSGYFYCDAVTGAQDYEWEFSNSGLNYLFVKQRSNGYATISRASIIGLQPGASYNVRVRAKVGGVWGDFGTSCSITLSTSIPSTQLASSQCGQTLADLSGYFYCDAVSGAQDFEWEFTNSTLGYSFTKQKGSGTTFLLRTAIVGLQYGQSYNVRVRANVGGVWGSFNNVCIVTIANQMPSTKLVVSQCDQTVNLTGNFNCDGVAGAQDYEWEFTNSASGYSFTKLRGGIAAWMQKSNIVGLQNGFTYNVRVRVKVGGVWSSFGPVCTVTINTSLMNTFVASERTMEQFGSPKMSSGIALTAFPNPSGNSGFEVSLKGLTEGDADVLLSVYDIYGKAVYSELFMAQSDGVLVKINNDGSFAKGIYILNAVVGGKASNQKLIIE